MEMTQGGRTKKLGSKSCGKSVGLNLKMESPTSNSPGS